MDAFDNCLNYYQIPTFNLGNPAFMSILEITLPINRLRYIFKRYMSIYEDNFLKDSFEMHMRQSGRGAKESPDISWLIKNLMWYIEDFAIDIGNRATDNMMLGYFEKNLKHISKGYFNTHCLIVKIKADNTAELGGARYSNVKYYSVSGKCKDDDPSLMRVNDNYNNQNWKFDDKYNSLPIARIRLLKQCGFTMEALCMLQSYLEVKLEHSLVIAMSTNRLVEVIKKKIIHKMGHNERIEILSEILKINKTNGSYNKKSHFYLEKIKEVYRRRNRYLHNLESGFDNLILTNEDRIKLNELMSEFVEAWKSSQFETWISSICCDSSDIAKSIINQHIQKRK
ncbi:hypothetical protein DSECCO2_607700 [anaerobic digester metagenome]